MKPQTNGMSRAHKANNTQIEGPNWLIFAAGALLSTLSIRLGYKLKQALDSKPKQNATTGQKGNGKSTNTKNSADYFMQSNGYSLTQDNHGCFGCISEFPHEVGDYEVVCRCSLFTCTHKIGWGWTQQSSN